MFTSFRVFPLPYEPVISFPLDPSFRCLPLPSPFVIFLVLQDGVGFRRELAGKLFSPSLVSFVLAIPSLVRKCSSVPHQILLLSILKLGLKNFQVSPKFWASPFPVLSPTRCSPPSLVDPRNPLSLHLLFFSFRPSKDPVC